MARSNDRGLFEKIKGSGVWWIRYAGHDGRERREQCGAKSYARKVYADRKREVQLRRQSPEMWAASHPAMFRALADDALAYCRHRHADAAKAQKQLGRMCEWWADTAATAITPAEIERQFSAMTVRSNRGARKSTRFVAGATVNRYRAMLSLTFRLAQKSGRVPMGFNPARAVELRKEKLRVRWLSADEEKRLREVLDREYPERVPILELALNTGLRWSDQARLLAEQRDGDTLRVLIGKTQIPIGLTINGIAGEAFEELAAQADDRGRLIREKSARGWFEAAIEKAAIEDFTWHDLRHTFATRLLLAGVPMQQVQKLLGHKSIAMTQRYAHVVEGFESDALAKLEKMNRHCASGGGSVTSIEKRKKKNLA